MQKEETSSANLKYSPFQRMMLAVMEAGGHLVPTFTSYYLCDPKGQIVRKGIRNDSVDAIRGELKRARKEGRYLKTIAYVHGSANLPKRAGNSELTDYKPRRHG